MIIHKLTSSALYPKNHPKYLEWRKSLMKRPPPWNKGLTKFDSEGVKKISDTFKQKRIDNFDTWRKNARRKGIIPRTEIPLERDTSLAFLIGLTLGDGNISKMERTECLRITLGTDKPKLWQYAVRIINRVFHKKPSVYKRSNSECMNITLYQNSLSKRLGIPCGARGKLKIKLPSWIWKDDKFLLAATKGLFEAEGSRSIHEPTYTYNLSFSNTNPSLLDEVEKTIMHFGFHPERRLKAVRIRRKSEFFAFQDLIRFRKYT